MPLTSSFKLSKSLSHLSSRVSDLEAENEDLKERLRFLDFQHKFESAVSRLTNSMMEDIATERMEHIKTHGSGWSMIDNLLKDHPDQENKIINVLKGNQDTRDQVESYASNTLRGYYKRTIDSGYGEYPSTWRSKLECKAKARMAKSLKDPHLFVLSIQLGDGDDIVAEVVKSSLKVGALPVDEIIRETMFTR